MIPLKLIDDKANDDINLSGVQTNSKMIENGNLFVAINGNNHNGEDYICLLYTSPSPRDNTGSRMPSSA